MKTHFKFLILAMLALMLFACSALADDPLPADVRAYFDGASFAGAEITDTAHWDEAGSGNTWFVLIREKNGVNTLHCFTPKDGGWAQRFATSMAVPQGKNPVEIYALEAMIDSTTDKEYTGPFLVISQMDEEDEYIQLFTAYKRSSAGVWNLFRVWSCIGYGNMLIGDGSITYYMSLESPSIVGTVHGTFQRNLRYFSLSALPKTYKEAKEKLTVAPALPEGSELKATEIQFTGGQKYPVYSAPDKQSLRGGNGKAAVSTNGWIQVFGKENGWILIQYSIDSGHYRMGYIEASALPKKAVVSDLDFQAVDAVIDHPTSVTDDPLYSQSALVAASAGDPVKWLATMGDWAYIEGANYRGFVPLGALAFPASAEEGYDVYVENGGEYDLFEITKLHYDANHKVYAVTGVYTRVVLDGDCYAPEAAENGAFTYALAPDFSAEMLNPDNYDSLDDFIPVTDLYAWYVDYYLMGEAPEGGLTFQCDVPEDEDPMLAKYDFWFITTRIRLNENNEVEYMRYYYVPWA